MLGHNLDRSVANLEVGTWAKVGLQSLTLGQNKSIYSKSQDFWWKKKKEMRIIMPHVTKRLAPGQPSSRSTTSSATLDASLRATHHSESEAPSRRAELS